jgi:hypothetical protein
MPFNTSFTTGDVLTATDLNTIAGSWDAYTPTIGGTGWALGNGTITGRWKKIGRVVHVRVRVTFGTTSTYGGGALTISAPTAAQGVDVPGVCILNDTGTATYTGYVFINGSTFQPFAQVTSAGHASVAVVISTVPFTWASTDYIELNITYESAS